MPRAVARAAAEAAASSSRRWAACGDSITWRAFLPFLPPLFMSRIPRGPPPPPRWVRLSESGSTWETRGRGVREGGVGGGCGWGEHLGGLRPVVGLRPSPTAAAGRCLCRHGLQGARQRLQRQPRAQHAGRGRQQRAVVRLEGGGQRRGAQVFALLRTAATAATAATATAAGAGGVVLVVVHLLQRLLLALRLARPLGLPLALPLGRGLARAVPRRLPRHRPGPAAAAGQAQPVRLCGARQVREERRAALATGRTWGGVTVCAGVSGWVWTRSVHALVGRERTCARAVCKASASTRQFTRNTSAPRSSPRQPPPSSCKAK